MWRRASKPEWQQGSIEGSIHRFLVGTIRQRARRVSRQLPVPPREFNVLHRSRPPGESAVRTPAPLPGLPLPTTWIGRPGTGSVRRDDGSSSGGATEGGAEPAADGEGQGIVWVLGSVSVSGQGTD